MKLLKHGGCFRSASLHGHFPSILHSYTIAYHHTCPVIVCPGLKYWYYTLRVILKKYPNWELNSNLIVLPASKHKSLAAFLSCPSISSSKPFIVVRSSEKKKKINLQYFHMHKIFSEVCLRFSKKSTNNLWPLQLFSCVLTKQNPKCRI